jgi:hypothetical protein
MLLLKINSQLGQLFQKISQLELSSFIFTNKDNYLPNKS